MKAAQASDMRKRANIAITGIWSPNELKQFVLKRIGKDNGDGIPRRLVTEEDILILHRE